MQNIPRSLNRFSIFVNYTTKYSGYFSGLILFFCALITCYEVVMRYVLNSPTHWTLDLSIFILIWFTFSSMAYVLGEGKHVAVDLIVSHFPPRTKALWQICVNVLFAVAALAIAYFGAKYSYEAFCATQRHTGMWDVLVWPVKLALPVGSFFLLLELAKDTAFKIYEFKTIPPDRGTGMLSKSYLVVFIIMLCIGLAVTVIAKSPIFGMVLLMLVLLMSGVPIFPALTLVGVIGIFFTFGGYIALWSTLPRVVYGSLDSFSLVCLPLFILVGQIIQSGGVGEEIYKMASGLTGRMPGGEAIATTMACAVFAAISTSSVATAATIGLIALPALAARNYDKPFSYGLLASGGTLGIMIPPSGAMIIYSAVTDESLGKLFLAGLIPGVLLALAFMVYSFYFCKTTGKYEPPPYRPLKERARMVTQGFWGLTAPGIILGGIYTGIFTPLESGAVAVVYALAMVILRGKVQLRDVPNVLLRSTLNGTMVLSIIVGAMVLGNFMTMLQVPELAVQYVQSLNISPWGVMVAILGLLTVLGMFLEVVSTMLITLPVIYPLIISLGFDGIWFAVIVALAMELALLTPPVGLNLYVITGIANTNLASVLKGVIPFFLIMVVALVIYCLVPELSTWLPSTMFER